MILRFTVLGTPVPKGSAKGFMVRTKTGPRAIVTHDNPNTKVWGNTVAEAANFAVRDAAIARGVDLERITFPMFGPGPIALAILFRLPRPKSSPPHKVLHQLTKPDKDKLERAIKDALKVGGVYADDNQVVLSCSAKCFPGVGRMLPNQQRDAAALLPGADVIVGPLDEMFDDGGHGFMLPLIIGPSGVLEWIETVGLEAAPERKRKQKPS